MGSREVELNCRNRLDLQETRMLVTHYLLKIIYNYKIISESSNKMWDPQFCNFQ